jgi:hypothetical protein
VTAAKVLNIRIISLHPRPEAGLRSFALSSDTDPGRASLRRREVIVHGQPFYDGSGPTRDRAPLA